VKIIWTPRALRDLEALHKYISKDSISRANDMVARILRHSTQLAEFPLSGRRVPEYTRSETREVIEPPYRVIYRIRGEAVDVLTVIHSSRKLR
jgi:addiction module RelE/StbE family toxin